MRRQQWRLVVTLVVLVVLPPVLLRSAGLSTAGSALVLALPVFTAALVGAILATARRSAPLVDLNVDGGALVVRPRGLSQAWSLRRELRVPLDSVAAIGAVPVAGLPVGLRSPGTAIPGFRAGSYGAGDQRSFWLVRRAPEVLVVELVDRPYRRLVLEVDDPGATAAELRAAIGRR